MMYEPCKASKALAVAACLLLAAAPIGSQGRAEPSFKVKAASLGGWLVVEGWMTPYLYDGIPNNDLLDGTEIQLKSTTTKRYLSAKSGGGSIIFANRTIPAKWGTFKLWRIDENTFNFRVFSGQFVGFNSSKNILGHVVAVASNPGKSEKFEIVRKANDKTRVKIKAPNGLFLQVKPGGIVVIDHLNDNGWGDNNPAIFVAKINTAIRGEYQVTNGYGPKRAPKVMRDHWNSYIVEDDFRFMSKNGVNTVRIPIGWWIASDPNPPKPFVGGSLEALDKAFSWAKTYNIKIIVDLHAAPGSQNGKLHSGTRDGTLGWGKSMATIEQTVRVIDFLMKRYVSHPSLYAIELINEPTAPGVALKTLAMYYQMGYNVVRKHSNTTYVIMSNRLGPMKPKELFPLASHMKRVAIDVHYYNLFYSGFNNMTVQQNINFIYKNRASQLRQITTSNGPLTFVGEWVAEWHAKGASKVDYQRFSKAQLQVFGNATFGWAYWSYKNINNHWSLHWMIKNGYITL